MGAYDYVLKLESTGGFKATAKPVVACLYNPHTSKLFTFGKPGGYPISDCVEILELADGLVICQGTYALDCLSNSHGLCVDPARVFDCLREAKKLYTLDRWAWTPGRSGSMAGAPASSVRRCGPKPRNAIVRTTQG